MKAHAFPPWIRGTATDEWPPRKLWLRHPRQLAKFARRPLFSSVLICLLAVGLILANAGCAGTPAETRSTENTRPSEKIGPIRDYHLIHTIEVRNLRDERLGHIQDLGLDLENGRIIEVLVGADEALFANGRTVAVPPLAFLPDPDQHIYRLNITPTAFAAAPAISPSSWNAAGRSNRVAAAYRYFGQEPYFVERGTLMSGTDVGPKLMLGYVERSSRIVDLPVTNLQQEVLGRVWSLSFDIFRGRIMSVIVMAPGDFKTKRVIPPMALNFNATREGLLLDDSKQDYEEEPRFIFTSFESGIDSHYSQAAYAGAPITQALTQGRSSRDLDITVRIHRRIHAANIAGEHVEVGTFNGRITLRGSVRSEADRIAVAAIVVDYARLELVDNQISVDMFNE